VASTQQNTLQRLVALDWVAVHRRGVEPGPDPRGKRGEQLIGAAPWRLRAGGGHLGGVRSLDMGLLAESCSEQGAGSRRSRGDGGRDGALRPPATHGPGRPDAAHRPASGPAVSATQGNPDEALNRAYRDAGGPTASLWEIAGAGHTGGIAAAPEEYERKVIGFFDDALLR
jgi:hypothetical protein